MRQFSTAFQWNAPAQSLGGPNQPLFELRAAATCAPCILGFKLRHLSYRVAGGNNTVAIGVATDAWTGTPLNPRALAAQDEVGDNALYGLTLSTEWTVKPTVPATFRRRASWIITGGGNSVHQYPLAFKFHRGLCLAPGTSMIIWGIAMFTDTNLRLHSVEINDLEVDA